MSLLRLFCRTLIVALLALCTTSAAVAGVQTTKSEFERRAAEYDKALVTPVHATPEQHHLIAVSLAAHHTPFSDLSEMLRVLDELSVQVTYLPQSDTSFWWDGIQWNPSTRSTYTYAGTKLTETISQSTGDGVTWVNETRSVNTYDGNGRLATSTSMTWSGGWVNESMTTFTYDGSGNVATMLSQSWSGSAWVNEFYSEMTYSGSNISTMITQIWSGSAWVNMRKDIYSYNASGVSEVLTQAWTGAWIDAERVVYTYDGSGRKTQQLSQLWRTSSWRNWFKNDYSYDGATTNEILDVRSDWDTVGSSWVAAWADTSRYSANRLIEMVTAYFSFPFVTRFLYTYDGAGNLTEFINQNGAGSLWMNFSRTVIVYTIAGIFDDDAVSSKPSEFDIGQNYPNPFNMNTVIPYSLSEDAHVRMTVCNILGQSVATLFDGFQSTGPHVAAWDGHDDQGHDVASGIYFFRLQTDHDAQVRKMVLLK